MIASACGNCSTDTGSNSDSSDAPSAFETSGMDQNHSHVTAETSSPTHVFRLRRQANTMPATASNSPMTSGLSSAHAILFR